MKISGTRLVGGNYISPEAAPVPVPLLYLDAQDYPGSGTNWPADVGSDATLIGGPAYTVAPPTYLSFDPLDVEYATVPDLGNLGTWTIETWFRATSSLVGRVTSVVCNQFDLSTKLNFSIGTNNAPFSYNYCVGFFDGTWQTTEGFSPAQNTWYQVVGTYDGTTIKQYVDGTISSQTNYAGTPQSGGEVRIARRWDSSDIDSNNFFPGDIGLVRIWNTALTDVQVTDLYNQNSSRFV